MKKSIQKTVSKAKANRPQSGDFFKSKKARLTLKNGLSYEGFIPTEQKDSVAGEVVFNTGMTGYVESLTDPSYANQILVFTYPLIGNYGVHDKSWESSKIHAKGVVVQENINDWSHPLSSRPFLEWLKSQNVPIIYNVDTRDLTQYLRTKGVINGIITSKKAITPNFSVEKPLVTISAPTLFKSKKATKTVVLVDCGAKENISRSLLSLNLNVLKVPHDYDYTKENYDGVMLSNGPGNPDDYQPTVEVIKKAFKVGKPIFGICLGSQLMALAAGASSYKLKFGHRGHNQPCMDMTTGQCYITSQNHGYAIDKQTLPKEWDIYFSNLNDGSVEGVIHKTKPFFAVQFHPEAYPGPTDTSWLFDKFRSLL